MSTHTKCHVCGQYFSRWGEINPKEFMSHKTRESNPWLTCPNCIQEEEDEEDQKKN
jgi:hypothetical protein